jgi:hypothetical protein
MTTHTYLLRPYNLGELLDQAIRLYRRNFIKFLGIMAIIQVPLSLIQLAITLVMFQGVIPNAFDTSTPPDQLVGRMLGGSGATLLVGLISFILVQGLATAALTRAVADNYLGRETGILDAYQRISSRWVSVLGAIVLIVLLSIALLVWTIVPCIGWLSGLGMLLFTSTVILPLVAPIVVLEGLPAGASIRRAWELARRRFWWILGFVFILYLFAQFLISGPTFLVSTVMTLFVRESGNPYSLTGASTILQTLVTLVMSLLYLPLQLTAITLMYFDLRVRTEGFDLTVLAAEARGAEASGQQADIDALTTQAPAVTQSRLITWTEVGYFVIITLGFVILYAILLGILFGFFALVGLALPAGP